MSERSNAKKLAFDSEPTQNRYKRIVAPEGEKGRGPQNWKVCRSLSPAGEMQRFGTLCTTP